MFGHEYNPACALSVYHEILHIHTSIPKAVLLVRCFFIAWLISAVYKFDVHKFFFDATDSSLCSFSLYEMILLLDNVLASSWHG